MDLFPPGLPTTVALALVALLGYGLGRLGIVPVTTSEPAGATPDPLHGSPSARQEIEQIAGDVRQQLAIHHASLERFRKRLAELREQPRPDAEDWLAFCREAEQVLEPTGELAADMASAYDQLRRHAPRGSTFVPVERDRLTGLANRHQFDKFLGRLVEMSARFEIDFALVLLAPAGLDDGTELENAVLCGAAELLRASTRGTDLAARFSSSEFALLLPGSTLSTATLVAQRICREAEEQGLASLRAGVAASEPGDSSRQLLARADAALYLARSSHSTDVFCHTGASLDPVAMLAMAAT